ncbi:TrmB family transcriptional regulator [Phenylobacterium sp. VNQ135]|uniref:TrmB family transcriptional regulator n=1 Tax=Phenylobacterium sp. VNQ135 TaxID=3400922 RepID=UPI003BFE3FEE
MTTTTPVGALLDLGFTETEALIYCELVRMGSGTGYRLAKAVGKASANTYAALESLSAKGAVLVDDVDGRAWRAVPARELMATLQSRFAQRSRAALDGLEALKPGAGEPRLYALKDADQVLGRARAMIEAATDVLLFDLFPLPFAELEPELRKAQARGVRVAGQIYDAVETPLASIRQPTAPAQLANWPGQQITLVCDGQEHLTALLSHDGAQRLHGVWTDSAYLACLQHSGLAAEIVLGARATGFDLPFDPSLFGSRPPGLASLTSPLSGDHR